MSTMYRVAPVPKVSLGESDLPKSMYKMPFLFDAFDNVKLAPNGVCPVKSAHHAKPEPKNDHQSRPENEAALNQLLKRQEQLLKKLTTMENEVKEIIAGVGIDKENAPVVSSSPVAAANKPKKVAKAKSPAVTVAPAVISNAKLPSAIVAQATKPAASSSQTKKTYDFSIHADVKIPLTKVHQLATFLREQQRKVLLKTFSHSTIAGKKVDHSKDSEIIGLNRSGYDFIITVIIKDLTGGSPYMVLNPSNKENVVGEKNIIQHIAKTVGITNLPKHIAV